MEISDNSCGTTDNTKAWDYLLRYQLSGSATIRLRDESYGQAPAKTEDSQNHHTIHRITG